MSELASLVLEDGAVFGGRLLVEGAPVCGEVVFNTAMTGYQEILTDPSYCNQLITLTVSHVGNVGVNPEDEEAGRIWARGMLINRLSPSVSNHRARGDLAGYFKKHGVTALVDVDTRALTRHLRQHGALRGCISTLPVREAQALAKACPSLVGADLACVVSTAKPYTRGPEDADCHLAVMDYGVKQQILNYLLKSNTKLTIFPAKTPFAEVMSIQPDGFVLSNGPGDPAACTYAVAFIKKVLATSLPVLGICLGFQLLALAMGAKTIKMKFGHHGANHPVQEIATQKVFISSQNHGFAVDEDSLPQDVVVTHRSLFDNTIQGFSHQQRPLFGLQGHPEASPGPQDLVPLFDDFIQAVASTKNIKAPITPSTACAS